MRSRDILWRRAPGRGRMRLGFVACGTALVVAACAPAATPPGPTARPSSAAALVRMQPAATKVTFLPGDPPHLAALHFVNAEDGWSGGQGVILATRDGGVTWQPQYLGKGSVTGLSFLSPTLGFAATSAGLLQTTNGRTWHLVSAQPLESVQFLSPSQGYALAARGGPYAPASYRLLATADGGQTWTAAKAGPVQQACFFSAGEGIAVPTTPIGGTLTVERTVDGGATWTAEFTLKGAFPSDLVCTPDGGAWLVATAGSGMSQASYSVFRSGDGGIHWTPVLARSTGGAGPAPGNTAAVAPGPGSSPGAIAATDKEHAVMVGLCQACTGPAMATLASTGDGGSTWETASASPPVLNPSVTALDMLTPRVGWLLSGGGLTQSQIEGTTDGGATWHRLLLSPLRAPPFGMALVNSRLGFGIGTAGDPLAVERTQSGGQAWATVGQVPGYGVLASASGGLLYYATNLTLLSSRDGGKRWETVTTALPQSMSSLDFATPKTGCAAASTGPWQFEDYLTRSGGKTWRKAPVQSVPAAVCAISLTDPALAREAVQLIHRLTTATGATAVPAYYLSSVGEGGGSLWVAFSNPPNSRLYVLSRNRPVQVHRWPDDQLSPVALTTSSSQEAYLMTSDGRLLVTRSGGKVWTQIK